MRVVVLVTAAAAAAAVVMVVMIISVRERLDREGQDRQGGGEGDVHATGLAVG